MFDKDFYPTPIHVIEQMIDGYDLNGKSVLEPSAGSGNIVNYALNIGANVIACEKHPDLYKIVATKCKMIAEDFLLVEVHQVSHIDYIIMNPPFSTDDKHILHAWNISPAGCKIISLCNSATIENTYSSNRKELSRIIKENGSAESLGDCFSEAERKTGVDVSLIKLQKPGASYDSEFEGFFTEDDRPEEQANGIMTYNVVRDVVNRYVEAIKLYDLQLELGIKMNQLTSGCFFTKENIEALNVPSNNKIRLRSDFKKGMQKAGWLYIFDKMNMKKYATEGLKADINKFVEQQQNIPFTMRNIYRMIDIVIGTQAQRMDKALVEVFDKLTKHYDENRYNVEGWKTNSHYLVNQKFIIPNVCWQDQRWYKGSKIQLQHSSSFLIIEDFLKALCYISGDRYDMHPSLYNTISYRYKVVSREGVTFHSEYDEAKYGSASAAKESLYKKGIPCDIIDSQPVYGEWFNWAYFRVKCFKKGTMHFEFKDLDLWAKFNQHIARIKGYPLFEGVKKTSK